MINENNNKPSSIWKLFKELKINKYNNSNNILFLKIGDKYIDDNAEIAAKFNKIFVSIASMLKELFENSNFDHFEAFSNTRIPNNIQFDIPEISKEKVMKYFNSTDISKATGRDQIGPRLIIIATPCTVDCITHICNQSIKTSVIPDQWKMGKVAPLHKNGSKDDVNNFRPISVLPVLSKIEKHVHDSLFFSAGCSHCILITAFC